MERLRWKNDLKLFRLSFQWWKPQKKVSKRYQQDKKIVQNLAFSLGFGLYQVTQTRKVWCEWYCFSLIFYTYLYCKYVVLFLFHFVQIECSAILVPHYSTLLPVIFDRFFIIVDGSIGLKMDFHIFFPWFGTPIDTTKRNEFIITFQPRFYYRIHLGKLQEIFSLILESL